jgi:DNA-binding response OmpR family regulator
MKILIIAGPYEADRLRKAAASAGFEAVAVEPGESLSGWITASRPELIVMAPQMVHPDPVQALAKVRSVPRGRVPILLVGDAADEARLTGIADGFFIRPVSPDELMERARLVLNASAKDAGNGAPRRARTGEGPVVTPAQ